MPSAIATTRIFPGIAVAQSKDNASPANPPTLATHVVNSGAAAGGIVSLVSNGNVFLDNWSLATGGKFLQTGATYFVAAGGRLATAGSQAIGIATSPQTLSVTIQSEQQGSISSSIASLQAQITALKAQVVALQNMVSVSQMVVYTTTDPTTDGQFPTNRNAPAIAYKFDGTGPLFIWDIGAQAWV